MLDKMNSLCNATNGPSDWHFHSIVWLSYLLVAAIRTICSISRKHYSDVIMSIMASQLTSLTSVHWSVCSCTDQRKYQTSASLPLWGNSPVTGEFTAQRASNAHFFSIWERHHEICKSLYLCLVLLTLYHQILSVNLPALSSTSIITTIY